MEFERLRAIALQQMTEVADRTFELPQGAAVLAYLEHFGPPELTQTNFLRGKIEVKKALVDVYTSRGKDAGAIKTHRPDDIYFLNDEGQQRLDALQQHPATKPAPKDLQVFRFNLHCGGGNRRGVDGASGANCERDPCDGKFCSSTTGSCDAGCAWAAMSNRQRSGFPQHLCRFKILITATLSQVNRGVVQLRTFGEHAANWTPVAPQKLTMSLTARDALIDGARAGPQQRSNAVAQLANALPEGMAATARTVPLRKQVTAVVAYDRRCSRGDVAGAFTAVDTAIRARHLSLAAPLPPEINRDDVIILFYQSGAGRTMQLVVSNAEALSDAHQHGRHFVMSDAKHDTSDTRSPFATLLCPAPDGGTLPLAVSVSSTENARTTAQLARSLQQAVPCGDANCAHPFMEEFSSDGAVYRRWRPCAEKELFVPVVGIDKSATSRDAFATVGMRATVCVFHNMQATIRVSDGLNCTAMHLHLHFLTLYTLYSLIAEFAGAKARFTHGADAVRQSITFALSGTDGRGLSAHAGSNVGARARVG